MNPRLLLVAVERSSYECVDLLLSAGADVNKDGDCALVQAAKKGDMDLVDILVEYGADVNKCLIAAILQGSRAILDLLLAKGADVNNPSADGDFPFLAALRSLDVEMVKLLLERGAAVNVVGPKGHTALMSVFEEKGGLMVAMFRKPHAVAEIVELLLSHGADATQGSPLLDAMRCGCPNIARQLLELGADVNAVSPQGDSALGSALQRGWCDMVLLLLEAGAKWDDTCCLSVLVQDRDDILELLIAAGADVENQGDGVRLLQVALSSHRGTFRCVEVLLQHGVDVTGDTGGRLLETAFRRGDTCIVKLLLAAGCFVSCCDASKQKKEVAKIRVAYAAGAEIRGVEVSELLGETQESSMRLQHICRKAIRARLMSLSRENLFVRVPKLGVTRWAEKLLLFGQTIDL